ncbi:hypothetical protein PLESTF_001656300 [Pleodorina starrii]|nr:hypothetical protein PLESTF_001656300 [Pleodorina starrii]
METDGTPRRQPDAEPNERSVIAHDAGLQQTAEHLSLRAGLLNGAFEKILQYGLQDTSREEFGGYFPSMDSDLVDALYGAYKQTLALVRSHCQEEYRLICSEQQVLDRLRTLDQIDQVQQPVPEATPQGGFRATPLGDLRATPLGSARRTPGSRKALAASSAKQAASEAVVRDAESTARRYALQQEAANLQNMLEKARRTENRLALTLALRQEAVGKMVSTYQQAVADVKQVYDITRAWPTAPRLNGSSD